MDEHEAKAAADRIMERDYKTNPMTLEEAHRIANPPPPPAKPVSLWPLHVATAAILLLLAMWSWKFALGLLVFIIIWRVVVVWLLRGR